MRYVEKVYYKTYAFKNGYLYIARGMFDDVNSIASLFNMQFNWIDLRREAPIQHIEFKNKLRDYQERAVSEILLFKNEQGFLEAECGSGKTIIGLSLISRLKQKTLVIVDQEFLLDQWVEQADKFLDIKFKVGKLSGSEKTISPITVCTIQTLFKMSKEEWKMLNKNFGCVIIDECHGVAASVIFKTVNNLSAMYRYGLSATIKRKDQKEFLIYATVGKNMSTITSDDLYKAGVYVKPSIHFTEMDSKIQSDALTWNQILDILENDTMRNEIIIENIVRDYKDQYTIIVLSSRVDHCLSVYNSLRNLIGDEVGVIVGSPMSKKIRASVLNKFRSGKIKVLVATSQIAAKGLDVQILSSVHLIMPSNNFTFLKQAVGRSLRFCLGKMQPVIRDYIDMNSQFLVDQSVKRKSYYRKMNLL